MYFIQCIKVIKKKSDVCSAIRHRCFALAQSGVMFSTEKCHLPPFPQPGSHNGLVLSSDSCALAASFRKHVSVVS